MRLEVVRQEEGDDDERREGREDEEGADARDAALRDEGAEEVARR